MGFHQFGNSVLAKMMILTPLDSPRSDEHFHLNKYLLDFSGAELFEIFFFSSKIHWELLYIFRQYSSSALTEIAGLDIVGFASF